MEHQQLLRSFEYSILHSEDVSPRKSFFRRDKDRASASTPLVTVRIDFEHGNFFLEGSWKFMMASNKNVRQSRAARKRERVRVKSALYPSLPLDLADENNENFFFTLDGVIQDDAMLSSCSGMLIVQQIRYTDGGLTGEWMLTFYLYDVTENGCEIKFNLPMLPEQHYTGLN
jgi:hypothetical protein